MTQQVNLYNPKLQEQRDLLSLKGAATGWALAAVCVLAWGIYEGAGLRAAKARNDDLTAQANAAQEAIRTLGARMADRKPSPEVTEEVARLEREVLGRQDVMAVLQSGRLGDTRGFSEHLRAFARQSFEGVWLTGLQIGSGGKEMVMEGRALQAAQVPNYLQRLNAEPSVLGHPFAELLIQLPPPEADTKAALKPWYVEFRLATKTDAQDGQKQGRQP